MAKGEISPTGSNREAALKESFSESSVVLCTEDLFCKHQFVSLGVPRLTKDSLGFHSALSSSSRFSNAAGLLLRNFVRLNPPVCKTVLISSALLRASPSEE